MSLGWVMGQNYGTFKLYLINSYIFIITQSINKYINIIYKLNDRGQYLPCIKGRIEKECTGDVLNKIQSGPNLKNVYFFVIVAFWVFCEHVRRSYPK